MNLFDWSEATIEGTDPLIDEFTGGIWMLTQAGYSQLDFSGGEIHQFDTHSDSYAVFSGGSIDEIRNYQYTDPAKNIEIVCRDWQYNTSTKILTGTWQDFTTFDIQLVDVTGREPTIDNILFTPEPATLVLFALGAALIRKRSLRG